MHNTEEVRVPVSHVDTDETEASSSRSGRGIQRATLTLVISFASLLLALGGIGLSFYMYKNGLQHLQSAQTEVQLGTVKKLANETRTTAAEARYAEEMNRLQTANENLRTDLLASQTALARAERERAAADAGLKGIDLGLASGTTGDPEFQRAVSRVFQQVVTPFVDCLSPKPGESKEALDKRCRGKDLGSLLNLMTPPSLSNSSKSDPFGLGAPAAPSPTAGVSPGKAVRRGIGQ